MALESLVITVATSGGLTLSIATMLWWASRRLYVAEDPRIDAVDELLPHANCGACGHPGCRPFAEALVQGAANVASCTVSDDAGRRRIAAYLGVAVGEVQRRVARLACAGGANVAAMRAHYHGLSSCAAASGVGGGGKGCAWGCLGLGDCERVCDFDAIHMDEQSLPVVNEAACTACGACVEACPKDLFSLVPEAQRLFVRCRSELAGEEALLYCDVGCDACGRCAKEAPSLITMKHNLPLVDPSRPHARAAIERCPTGAIVWFDAKDGPQAGEAARPVVRHEKRPAAST